MGNTSDYMVRATAADGQVRAFAVTGRELVQAARKAHGTTPVATAALGRTMCGALMMADMLKGDKDLITIQITADGPLGGLTVTADNSGHVKGYVINPMVLLPPKADGHLDVGGAVGKGVLTIIRDLDLKNTYTGQVELQSGEIAEDIARYFAESEQVPSAVGLGVLVGTDMNVLAAGGYIIQLMPFAQEPVIDRLEKNIASSQYVTDMLSEGYTPESMLELLLDGLDPQINDSMPVQFFCSCDKDRVERALILLGEDEIRSMAAEQEETVLTCQFCKRAYHFTRQDLLDLISRQNPENGG